MIQCDELSVQDRAECAVCADLLSTGVLWSQAALLAMLAVLIAAFSDTRIGSMPVMLIALLVLGIIERVLALRVAIDARLFDRLARNELRGLAMLDAALHRVLAVPVGKSGRELAPRIAGAKQLYRAQVVASMLLAGLAVMAWWPR